MRFLSKIQDGGIVPFIMGTQTTTTGVWTGTTTLLHSLEDGQVIHYWLPRTPSGNATLTLTLADGSSTGAVNCYYGGTTRLTTHYAAGSLITMMYRLNGLINGVAYTGWWADADYYSDTGNYSQRYYANIKAETAIVANNIIVGTVNGYKHLKLGTAFDITLPILYAGSAISAGSTGTNNYCGYYFTISTTQAGTWVAYAPIFIKGTLVGTTFTPVSTTPLTQTIPDTEDGYVYYLIGFAYTTANMQLTVNNSLYEYKDGVFKLYSPVHSHSDATTSVSGFMSGTDKTKLGGIATGATKVESSPTNGKIKINGTDTTVYTHPTDASSRHIPSSAGSGYDEGYVLTVQPDGSVSWEEPETYTHPSGDGNLHVPANGTTNSGKVLTAGATAGSMSWQTPSTGGSVPFSQTDVYDDMQTYNIDLTNYNAMLNFIYQNAGDFIFNITGLPSDEERVITVCGTVINSLNVNNSTMQILVGDAITNGSNNILARFTPAISNFTFVEVKYF